ncbi:MAG: hypothetical protein WCC90_16300 [Methylocella sp.]
MTEGGCLSFIVVIAAADSSAAGTGGTSPNAMEAAMKSMDMPLRLGKADAVPHASRGYASRRRPVDFGTTRAPRVSILLSPPRELFLDLARYSSLAARGYNFVLVVGRNAVNKAEKSRIAFIEVLLRTRSKIYLTFSDYVPAFRIPYVYFLPGGTREAGNCAIPKYNSAITTNSRNSRICVGIRDAIPPSFAWASQGLPALMVNFSGFCLYQKEER